MTILYFNEADRVAAEALPRDPGEEVLQFKEGMTFSGSVSDITLVAHTSDDDTIGGMTPKRLAQALLGAVKPHQDQLKHIYLISCEAGLCQAGKPSLAQQFSSEMKQNHFDNLQVHAVVNPTDTGHFGMRFEVLTWVGIHALDEGRERGDLMAFVYGNQKSKEIDDKIAEVLEQLKSAEEKFGKKSSQYSAKKQEHMVLERQKKDLGEKYQRDNIFQAANEELGGYRTAMKQPAYTFIGNNGPQYPMSKAVSAAMFELENLRLMFNQERKNKPPKGKHNNAQQMDSLIEHLNTDINYLRQNPTLDAKAILSYFNEKRQSKDGLLYMTKLKGAFIPMLEAQVPMNKVVLDVMGALKNKSHQLKGKHLKYCEEDLDYLRTHPDISEKDIQTYFEKTRNHKGSTYYQFLQVNLPLLKSSGVSPEHVSVAPFQPPSKRSSPEPERNPAALAPNPQTNKASPFATSVKPVHYEKNKLQEHLTTHFTREELEASRARIADMRAQIHSHKKSNDDKPHLPSDININALKDYNKTRKSEWGGFHFNFLMVKSFVYFLLDRLTGTDYLDSRSKEIKVKASDKLIDYIDGKKIELFTSQELNALKDGRLGVICKNLDLSALPHDSNKKNKPTDEARTSGTKGY